jgi:hypothetical protein
MRNTFRVTYRSLVGRIKTDELTADSLFDSAASVCQAHKLKSDNIISNVIKDRGKAKQESRKYKMP